MTAGRLLRSVGVAAILGGLAVPAQSADFWMSRVTIIDGGKSRSMTAAQFALESPLMATSATAVFDLSISLEENPQGDDKYPEDSGTGDADQNAYEAKIEEFADAVYQATNGAHKIGKVTVFRDGDLAGVADVTWEKDCASSNGPWAYPSTFGVAGGIIHMCTTWSGAPSLMDTPKGGGFTLAHEWMHYAYGVYDEYSAASCTDPVVADCGPQPLATDTASTPSIMNNQWAAARSSGADADFLEFSTSNIAPFGTNTGTNAQDRVFGESAWETLTRSPSTDPRHAYLPTRTQYTTLTAPTTPNWVVNDSETTARSELDVIWAGDQVVELMIDTSGSMNGTPMDNAKTASSLLVGQLTDGQTAIGVGEFNSLPFQRYAITDIPDPDTGIKAAAQAIIGGFSAVGQTNIQSAALLALKQTRAFKSGSRPSVVYLLTDGRSTVNVAAVTGPYTAAKVPLITFGFGPSVDAALLTSMATGTGGAYFNSSTTLAEIQQAFIVANAAFSSNVVVSSATASAAASATSTRTVTLDGTLATAVVNVTYDSPGRSYD
jgi:uncharacterized protein YegL